MNRTMHLSVLIFFILIMCVCVCWPKFSILFCFILYFVLFFLAAHKMKWNRNGNGVLGLPADNKKPQTIATNNHTQSLILFLNLQWIIIMLVCVGVCLCECLPLYIHPPVSLLRSAILFFRPMLLIFCCSSLANAVHICFGCCN